MTIRPRPRWPDGGQWLRVGSMIADSEATHAEIEANHGFEVAWSRAQTALQWLIGLLVAAGLLGAFGNGWLATATRTFPGMPVTVTYQRLLRANAPTDVTLVTTGRLPDDTLRIGVGAALLERAVIGGTQPGAAEVSTTPKGVTYIIRFGPDHSGHVMLKLAARKAGPVDLALTVNGARLDLPLFVYP